MKSDNPNVKGIKHMAFAVRDAEAALAAYARFLHVPADTKMEIFPKSKNKVALFYLGGIEYQLCESQDPQGRFARPGPGREPAHLPVLPEIRLAPPPRGLGGVPGQRGRRHRDRVHAGLHA
ncbi:MAG: hypothetical protein MUF73_20395 [Rhodobacteraceae bacterium]|nr:hypothetical protein [Paracoccaceae bacterium]